MLPATGETHFYLVAETGVAPDVFSL